MPAVAEDDSGTWNDHTKMKTCRTCQGEGSKVITVTDAKGKEISITRACQPCNGKGTV